MAGTPKEQLLLFCKCINTFNFIFINNNNSEKHLNKGTTILCVTFPINSNIGYYGQTTRNNVKKYCSQNKVVSVYLYVSTFTYQKESYDFRYFKRRNCKNYVLGHIGRVKHLIRLLI